VRVPLDYDRPRSGRISIALARLPATDPAHRIGSLFLNPGGPGGSGVDFLFGAGPFLYTDEVRARFDLVGFDPRGIIRSNPLRCFNSPEEWEPYFVPFAFPLTREEEQAWIAGDRYLLRACDRKAGRIIDHMSTANAARDLDVLRAAVGDSGGSAMPACRTGPTLA
jgi:pimeloyl-ACP methyl ester carboxylesterase